MVGSWTVGCDHDASILCRSSRFLMMPCFVSIALFLTNIQRPTSLVFIVLQSPMFDARIVLIHRPMGLVRIGSRVFNNQQTLLPTIPILHTLLRTLRIPSAHHCDRPRSLCTRPHRPSSRAPLHAHIPPTSQTNVPLRVCRRIPAAQRYSSRCSMPRQGPQPSQRLG
jgi:hypothetical protein